MVRLITICFICVVFANGLFAINRNEDLDIRLEFFCPFQPTPMGLYLKSGNEMIPVKFARQIRGDFVRYQGPNPIVFYREAPAVEGEDDFRAVASVYISEGIRGAYLIFHVSMTPDGDQSYTILPIDASSSRFPKGSLYIINMTSVEMVGMIGSQRSKIQPGISGPFRMENSGNFRLGLALEFQNKIYPTFHNTVMLDANTRQMMFIAPPRREGSRRVQARFFEDQSLLRSEETDG